MEKLLKTALAIVLSACILSAAGCAAKTAGIEARPPGEESKDSGIAGEIGKTGEIAADFIFGA
ncbi:MAG: hypothetical protein FWF04_05220, partial [Clostridiales bacterium]|nr:hypothetical protein [Clostridiales bacterium]